MRDLHLCGGFADNPALLLELGDLNVAWASLELRIFQLFALLTGLPIPIARAIYYSLRTTRSRIELVQAVAPIVLRQRPRGPWTLGRPRWILGPPLADLRKVSKTLGEIGRMSGERNKFVHDPWVGHETNNRAYQMRLGGKEIHGNYESIRVRDVRSLVLRVQRKADALHRLRDSLSPKIGPLLGILELHHELTLESSKKSIPPKKKKARR